MVLWERRKKRKHNKIIIQYLIKNSKRGIKMISLTIDGKKATVKKGTTILEAAKSIGIKIPTLCYDPRICLLYTSRCV